MTFDEVKVGDIFRFTTSNTVYRKVNTDLYIYYTDAKGIWTYWCPKTTQVIQELPKE